MVSGLCVWVAVPRGMGELTTVLYSTSVVAASFSEVTRKTTINSPAFVCHWHNSCI